MTVTWIDARRFRVGDVEFACSAGDSTPERFCVRKPRRLVEMTVDLVHDFPAARIVELGIASGGSTALLALVARPRKLVAIEMHETPVEALRALIEERQLGETIRPFYGFDQSDRARLTALVQREFGDEPLDLVIDDASHRLEETRASFETLFPRLRPGSLYVVEDWNWQLRIRYALANRANKQTAPESAGSADTAAMVDEAGAKGRADFQAYLRDNLDRPTLETLALQLVTACACSGDAIAEVNAGENWLVVRRGPAALDPATFRIADTYVSPPGGFAL